MNQSIQFWGLFIQNLKIDLFRFHRFIQISPVLPVPGVDDCRGEPWFMPFSLGLGGHSVLC